MFKRVWLYRLLIVYLLLLVIPLNIYIYIYSSPVTLPIFSDFRSQTVIPEEPSLGENSTPSVENTSESFGKGTLKNINGNSFSILGIDGSLVYLSLVEDSVIFCSEKTLVIGDNSFNSFDVSYSPVFNSTEDPYSVLMENSITLTRENLVSYLLDTTKNIPVHYELLPSDSESKEAYDISWLRIFMEDCYEKI